MAHTNRTRANDRRPHPALYPVGSRVGMMTSQGKAEGKIISHDAGGWIYVNWDRKKTPNVKLPEYLRSTHVALIDNQETKHAA